MQYPQLGYVHWGIHNLLMEFCIPIQNSLGNNVWAKIFTREYCTGIQKIGVAAFTVTPDKRISLSNTMPMNRS